MRVIASVIAACALVSFGVVADVIMRDGGSEKATGFAIYSLPLVMALGIAALVWTSKPAAALVLAFWQVVACAVLWLVLFWWWPTAIVSLVGAGAAVALQRVHERRAQARHLATFPPPPARPRATPPPPRW